MRKVVVNIDKLTKCVHANDVPANHNICISCEYNV